MIEDRVILEKIKKVLEAHDADFEAIAEKMAILEGLVDEVVDEVGTASEVVTDEANAEIADAEVTDAEILRRIKALLDKDEAVFESDVVVQALIAEGLQEVAEPDEPQEPTPLPTPPVDHEGRDYLAWMSTIEARFRALTPRTRIGKFFARDRHNAALGIMLALIILTASVLTIDYLIPQNVTVTYITFAGEETIEVITRKNTAEDAIEAAGIELGDNDYVSVALDYEISTGDAFTVMAATETTAKIKGETKTFYLIAGTIEENLIFNNISYDDDDIVKPALDEIATADTSITFSEVHYVTAEQTETIEYESLVILDPTLTSGKVESIAGSDGEGVVQYTTRYVNGVEKETTSEVIEWITEPVNETLRLGTSLTGDSGTYTITKTFTANTTAYYFKGSNVRGASGKKCTYGTCAVDASRYPYGTIFFVEGYGIAVANDCGSAVKGDILDLYMHSYSEAVQWGRRYLTTYVLVEAD